MTKYLEEPIEEFYLDLFESLLLPDCVSSSSYFQSQSRKDYTTVLSRSSSSECFQFCTKTLPKLGKAFDAGLVNGQFLCPREFKRARKNMSIPAFLQGYFALVFNCEDGTLLAEPAEFAVKHIRQVCFWYYKLELPFSRKEEANTIAKFIATEVELEGLDLESNLDLDIAADMTGGTFYSGQSINIFGNFDPDDITPKHGPGAVASGEKGEEKWIFKTLYQPIHAEYPYWQYTMMPGESDLNDLEESMRHLTVSPTGGIAKVVLVPKDSRGPRLISMEPLEYMWFQKGLGESMVCHLERASKASGNVNFTTQSVNRLLSLTGSTHRELSSPLVDSLLRDIRNKKISTPIKRGGSWVTLDLRDASDRVSVSLVKRIFSKTPTLLRKLLALRSTATTLPDGRVIPLKKYAPMGSALCFPVEAYCFWIIIVAAISRHDSRSPYKIMKNVFVYGDDIIVEQRYSQIAIDALERAGLKVNTQKCCLTGKFRESCGIDAYDGIDVTPVKVRTCWTGNRTDHEALASWVSYANSIRQKGYSGTYYQIKSHVEKTYGGIPYGDSRASYICWYVPSWEEAASLNRLLFKARWDASLQSFQHKFRGIRAKKFESTLDGYSRLLRNLTSGPGPDPSVYSLPRARLSLIHI